MPDTDMWGKMMALHTQQQQEQDALSSENRVADAIMKASQPRPYQWQPRKRQGRFAVPPSGLGQLGGVMQDFGLQYGRQQALDALREQQRQAMLTLFPTPQVATDVTK